MLTIFASRDEVEHVIERTAKAPNNVKISIFPTDNFSAGVEAAKISPCFLSEL